MANAFWCIVEDDRQGAPKKVMSEVIGEASRLAGGQVEAVWLTDKATDAGLKQLGEWGAGKVWLLENAGLAPYRSEVWAGVLADLAAKQSPRAILGAVTSRQRELVPRLAAKLGVGLAADCVALAMDGDKLVATRPVYAGKLLAKVTWAKGPWVATLRPNVFRPADAQPGKTAAVERPAVSLPAAVMKFVERREEVSTGLPDLAEALSGLRRLGCDPAPCGDADVEDHRRREQGRGGADLQDRRLRHRGRPLRGGSGAHQRVQAAAGEMKLELSEEQQMIQTMAREFAESAIRPIAAEIDREARFPHETVKRMGELGLMGIGIPETWGGSGADTVAYVVALEEIARVCASHAVIMSVNNSLYGDPVYKFGTVAQRERFLTPVASGHAQGCFALTEPQAGSDATNQHTVAIRDGD